MEIKLYDIVGKFAENKDLAREIRTNKILPALEKNDKVILDFGNIEATTQSFIHALISDIIRKKNIDVLKNIYFKNCNITVKKIITIVTEYMQDSS
ncbi:STAS-like domain-containing protein [archaeon]|nr:STAS-like domain-containing protein [archaeon]